MEHATTQYDPEDFYDEVFEAKGVPRPGARLLVDRISELPEGDLLVRQRVTEKALLQMGITFTVYGDTSGTEKIFPFDIIPRIVTAEDWQVIESGL